MRARPLDRFDDPAAVADQRQQLLGQEEHAFEIDPIEHVHLLFRRLLDGIVVGDAGIVDEIVEMFGAEFGERCAHLLDEGVERGDLPHIERQGDGLAPAFGDQGDYLFGLGAIGL